MSTNTQQATTSPHVLVVLVDDMGFGASSAFGGPISMPAADRLARGGLRFSRFHTTAICSPTRQALLTGRNHHRVGMGHITELATDEPGYSSIRPDSAATLPRMLRDGGYSTLALGKMHQTPAWEVSPVGPFDRWPTGEGFDQFYGFLGGETDQYYPRLYEGTSPVPPPATPEEGYHLSEDLADRAIRRMQDQLTFAPERPLFTYLSFGACHAPLHVDREWRERYRGKFDAGFEVVRQRTFERQREMGLIPADAELPEWLEGLPRWDELTDDERRAGCLLMELFAGFAEHMDHQVGRVLDEYERMGVLDDTIVLYLLGDNGASAEGGLVGTYNENTLVNGSSATAAEILARADRLGDPTTYPHYPVPWAYAMNSPYQWTKQVASHYGGTRNGLIVHWPAGTSARGEIRHQWHHVNDITPTLLDLAGVEPPKHVDGVEQMDFDGVSMRYCFDDATAEDRHTTQYFEVFGNRGIYHDGWVACTKHRVPWLGRKQTLVPFEDDEWELYDTTTDWTQARNVAKEHTDRLAELQVLFGLEAERNDVLPLDDRGGRINAEFANRPSLAAGRRSATYHGRTRQLPEDAVIPTLNRSHRVFVRAQLSSGRESGVLVAQGGAHGGWSLYLRDGVLEYCNNVLGREHQYVTADTTEPIGTGAHELGMSFAFDGGRLGAGGDVSLLVDGEVVGTGRIEATTTAMYSMSDAFNVGADLGSLVSQRYAESGSLDGSVLDVRIEIEDDVVRLSEEMRVAAAEITQ